MYLEIICEEAPKFPMLRDPQMFNPALRLLTQHESFRN